MPSASRTAASAWLTALAAQFENRVASLTLAGIMLLPLAEIASRRFLHAAIPGSAAIVSALTLWLGMLGAAVAARDGKLLTLATGEFLPKGRVGVGRASPGRHRGGADRDRPLPRRRHPRCERSHGGRQCSPLRFRSGSRISRCRSVSR